MNYSIPKYDSFNTCFSIDSPSQNEIKAVTFFQNNTDENIDVSIAIPTYNRLEELFRCINSVKDLVETSFNIEIIVSDNTSLDNNEHYKEVSTFLKKCNFPNVKYYGNEKNIGGYGNWNRAMNSSRGNWIMLLHDDDVIHPLYLKAFELYLSKYESNTGALVSLGDKVIDGEKENEINLFLNENPIINLERKKSKLMDYFYSRNRIVGCFLLKREILNEIGGFPIDGHSSEDEIFAAKITNKYSAYRIEMKLHGYIMSKISDSHNSGIWSQISINQYFFRKQIIHLRPLLFRPFLHLISKLKVYSSIEAYKRNPFFDDKNSFNTKDVSDFLNFSSLFYYSTISVIRMYENIKWRKRK